MANHEVWHQVGWKYDLMLTHLLDFAIRDNQQAGTILNSLIGAKSAFQLQLEKESDFDLQWYFASIDTLKQWYVDTTWSLTIADYIHIEYANSVDSLYVQFSKAYKNKIEAWLSESN